MEKKALICIVGVSMYPWVAPEGRSRQLAMHFRTFSLKTRNLFCGFICWVWAAWFVVCGVWVVCCLWSLGGLVCCCVDWVAWSSSFGFSNSQSKLWDSLQPNFNNIEQLLSIIFQLIRMMEFFWKRILKLKPFFSIFNIGTDKTTTMNKTTNHDGPAMQFERNNTRCLWIII